MANLYVDPATGWEIPVAGGVITQGYGPENTDPSVRHLYRKGYHTGIDIGGIGEGAPVLAPRDATAVLAGWNGGYGNCVILETSDGVRWLFGHLSSVAVAQGDTVVRSQEIGGAGTTGVSTGVHLHYEIRRGDDDIDPVPFLLPAAPPAATTLTAVVAEDLNLRTGPSKNDPVIMTLPAGTTVQVGQDGWLPVWYEGRQGWMFAEFLRLQAPPASQERPSAARRRKPGGS
jgi:murein DD-endopeptidase MepM/ murein hydrolase activator NlpD